jgi:hypothetical protein
VHALLLAGVAVAGAASLYANVSLDPPGSASGYLARLLINEAPFPGERGWVSEADTEAAMLSILWVLESRLKYIPPGYTQEQIAATRAKDLVDVITAGGEKGQCDGFYRDAQGRPASVPRVQERVDYLMGIANKGTPGRFARLLNHAQGLANAYVTGGVLAADRYAGIARIGSVAVTGRAYSWMTNADCYHPGGTYVRIPDTYEGMLGGNRFFTLQEKQ